MPRIGYLVKRICQLDYRNMFQIAKAIHHKTHRPTIGIVVDMIYCGIAYQAGYYDYQEFEFYLLNRAERKTYLTRGKNNEIIHQYNQKEFIHYFADKIEFNQTFAKYIHHDWLSLKDGTQDDFVSFFQKHPKIIVKPIDLSGGKGIETFTYTSEAQAHALYETLLQNHQLLVEEYVVQHEELNHLYSGSVNTLRMFTFIKDGKPHFLQAILKMGNGGIVDNFSSGGMYTYVDENGKVFVPAIDQADHIFEIHPTSHEKIVGFQVPFFSDAVALVKECAKVIPQVAYVGWDVAITPNGPDIIEGNEFPGVFQVKASLSQKKEGLLPKYKELGIF